MLKDSNNEMNIFHVPNSVLMLIVASLIVMIVGLLLSGSLGAASKVF